MFILMERWTSILKMAEIEVFLMKPRYQYHLTQWGKCVYGAQSWKVGRLLCEYIFVQIDRWTVILKMAEKEVFSYETEASISFIQ